MEREGVVLELIEKIYAAGFGEIGWDKVTGRVRDLLGCSVVAIHVDDTRRGEAIVGSTVGVDPEEEAKYEEYYVTRNPWVLRAAPFMATGRLLLGEAYVSQQELHCTEYYNDFARPNGLGRALAVCLHYEPDLLAFFSHFKSPGDGPFSDREVALVRTLAPHLQRASAASGTFHRLRAERELAVQALDALPRGAAILDARGHVVVMNRILERIVRAGDGISFQAHRLRFAHRSAQRALDSILAREGFDASGGVLRARRPSMAADYEVVVTRLPALDEAPSVFSARRSRFGWLLMVSDPVREPVSALRGLRRMYGLTGAEAEVADLLVAGRSLPEIGELRNTSLNTVKTQVRSIHQKVDVSSRAELVRRLSGLQAGAGPETFGDP